jgi:hypothetical protein
MKCGAYCVDYYKFTHFGLILKQRIIEADSLCVATNVQIIVYQLK